MSDPVLVERQGAVALVTLNQPERRNALSAELRDALLDSVEALFADENCRALILTGADNSFCAGGDLTALRERDPMHSRGRMQRSQQLIRLLVSGPKPVVAAVNGYAFGAGFSLALACDYVLASTKARFGAVFGAVGLMGDLGLLWSLPQRVGVGEAKRLLFSNAVLDAEEAVALRVADRLVQQDELLAEAHAIAGAFAKAPPVAVAQTKSALARGPASLDSMLQAEAEGQTLLLGTDDFAEGRRAFQEKRDPCFSGR